MNIYRLDPIAPADPSWRYSVEKDSVWACAATPEQARDLVAVKTGFVRLGDGGAKSPWQDETVTSCVLQPTMAHLGDGDVVREDGSNVDYSGADAP